MMLTNTSHTASPRGVLPNSSQLGVGGRTSGARSQRDRVLNQESLETWFAFSTIFATGSCLAEVDGVDYRKAFSNWWKTETPGGVIRWRDDSFQIFQPAQRLFFP